MTLRRHDYTLLEMMAMHLRKVLKALIWLRRDRGQPAGDPVGLTAVIVELGAAIFGARLSERYVENLCVGFQVSPDRATLTRLTEKARREVSTGHFEFMPAKQMGKLLDLLSEEKWTLAEKLELKRIFIEPIDHAEDKLRRKRESAKSRRAENSAGRESGTVGAKRLGVSRASLYRHGSRDPETLLWTYPMERIADPIPTPKAETETWTLPGPETKNVDDPLYRENIHDSVSDGVWRDEKPPTPERDEIPPSIIERKRAAS